MDREAWRATVHGVAKSQTRLSHWTELNWTPASHGKGNSGREGKDWLRGVLRWQPAARSLPTCTLNCNIQKRGKRERCGERKRRDKGKEKEGRLFLMPTMGASHSLNCLPDPLEDTQNCPLKRQSQGAHTHEKEEMPGDCLPAPFPFKLFPQRAFETSVNPTQSSTWQDAGNAKNPVPRILTCIFPKWMSTRTWALFFFPFFLETLKFSAGVKSWAISPALWSGILICWKTAAFKVKLWI